MPPRKRKLAKSALAENGDHLCRLIGEKIPYLYMTSLVVPFHMNQKKVMYPLILTNRTESLLRPSSRRSDLMWFSVYWIPKFGHAKARTRCRNFKEGGLSCS